MGVTRFDHTTERQLREIVDRGIASFKVFLAYKGAFGIDDSELYRTLSLAKELGVIVTAHCKNETAVFERQQQLLNAGQTGPQFHEPSRPTFVEAEGVHHLMTFVELTEAHVYVVHTNCDEALQLCRSAKWTDMLRQMDPLLGKEEVGVTLRCRCQCLGFSFQVAC